METNINAELIEKAKQAKSAEELLTLARENDIDISEEDAQACFEELNKSGELSDDELDDVAGGMFLDLFVKGRRTVKTDLLDSSRKSKETVNTFGKPFTSQGKTNVFGKTGNDLDDPLKPKINFI